MQKIKLNLIYRILAIIAPIAILAGGAAMLINPYRGTATWGKLKQTLPVNQILTREEGASDLKYLVDMINDRHLSAVHGLPAPVKLQYEKEIENLPAEPSVLDIWTASSKILKQLNDAHSSAAFYSASKDAKRLDQRFLLIDSDVICTTDPYKGWKVEKINNVPVNDLYNRFLSMYSYENIDWANRNFPLYLRIREDLGWLGVEAGDAVDVVFNDNGVQKTATLPFVQPPQTPYTGEPDFVRYKIDRDRGVGILTLDECNFNQEYRDTVHKFFADVKAEGIRNIAVDLRKNGGGNSEVANEFLRYLPIDAYKDYGTKMRLGPMIVSGGAATTNNTKHDGLTYDGKVFVLTSNGTFSSAMWFAVLLRDNNLCKVIGQPPGNKPSAYGDILVFQMPNSKLAFTLTYKQFNRPDASKDNEDTLMPDYPTKITVDGDGVMEKLYEVIQ